MNIKTLVDIIVGKYNEHYFPIYELKHDFSDCISDIDEANYIIKSLVESDEPCMIGRIGSVEFRGMYKFLKGHHPFSFFRSVFPFWVSPTIINALKYNAGFFSDSYSNCCRFADLYYESAKQIDVLGSVLEAERLIDAEMHYKKCKLGFIEPFFSSCPWTSALKGKRVLVVHPYAESIQKQYLKREVLFENKEILPEFQSLSLIKAVQTIAGEETQFNSWFDALRYMEDQVDSIDYDIAIIGCGAYGMPLAAHVKKMGRKAIHLGGPTQLLFGIRGKRWEEECGEKYKELLNNPNWIRPSEEETPKAAQTIENGCYW